MKVRRHLWLNGFLSLQVPQAMALVLHVTTIHKLTADKPPRWTQKMGLHRSSGTKTSYRKTFLTRAQLNNFSLYLRLACWAYLCPTQKWFNICLLYWIINFFMTRLILVPRLVRNVCWGFWTKLGRSSFTRKASSNLCEMVGAPELLASTKNLTSLNILLYIWMLYSKCQVKAPCIWTRLKPKKQEGTT